MTDRADEIAREGRIRVATIIERTKGNDRFVKCIAEARIWIDDTGTYTKDEQRRARRRFDYALHRVSVDDLKPNPIERLQIHMAAVEYAKHLNKEKP